MPEIVDLKKKEFYSILVSHGSVAVAAVRAWEQNLRTPDLAAQTLLRVIESYPDAVRRAVRAA